MDILVVLLIFTSFILIWIFLGINDKRKTAINKFPGPKSYPLTGTTLPFLFKDKPESFAYIRSLAKKFGPLYRTWIGATPVVNITDPQYAEVILNSSNHISKGLVYVFLLPWLGDGLLTSKGAKWHRHRKLLTPAFHFKILETFMNVFISKSELLVGILSDKADGKTAFNIFPYITHCTLDIIAETAMGIQVNAMAKEKNTYAKAVYGICKEASNRMQKSWLKSDFVFSNTGAGKRFYECLSTLHKTTYGVIAERKALREKVSASSNEVEDEFGRKKRRAFLDLLIDASKDGTVLTNDQIREEVDTFMFEGHDTTTASIAWTLFLLGLHHDIQEKVFEEVNGILQDDKPLDFTDVNEMKYLERVLKESLRLYPSVAAISRIASEDIVIDNSYTIPKGTSVTVHIFDIHHNKKYFAEPEKFDPDRFLPERSKDRHPYAYIPFSAGPRNCIGQKFALVEEKVVVSHILKSYKVYSMQNVDNVLPVNELILRPYKGLTVILEKRK